MTQSYTLALPDCAEFTASGDGVWKGDSGLEDVGRSRGKKKKRGVSGVGEKNYIGDSDDDSN